MATFLANLTAGADSLLGTAGDDIIQVPPSTANLSGADTIAAGAGFDTLLFLRDTSLAVGHTLLTNVSGVDEFDVRLAPSVHMFLNDVSILQSDSDRLRITFDADPMTLDLRAVSASLLDGIELNGSGTVTLYDAARQSLRIADGVNGTVIGGIGRDAITGGSGAESLTGGFGDDILRGNGGADSLLGGDDQDWLYGGAGNDSLIGGTGFDLLEGGSGTNTATGGTEADTFVISAGETLTITDFDTTNSYERIDLRAFAGLGFADLVIAANGGNARITLPQGSTITLTGVAAAALRPETFIFAGDAVVTPAVALGVIPFFEFTANNDTVIGTTGSDLFEVKGVFSKLAATDSFDGRGGIDTLRVWGADRILSEANLAGMRSIEVIDLTGATGALAATVTQALVTQSGNGSLLIKQGRSDIILDTETAGGVSAVVVEGTGQVTLRNVDGQSVSVSDAIAGRVQGGSRADEIQGGARNDTLNGNDGNDSIAGGAGNDAINGGAGDDSITGGTGVNTVTGGTGTDRYVVSAGETLIITDFDLTNDFERIDLSRFAGLRYADLVMADTTGGVEISLPGSTTVRVLGISRSAMDATKFFFEGTLPSLLFQLTAGADSFVGGAGDDLFDLVGNIANLDAATDRLQGGAGIDTLRISGTDRVLSAQLLNVMQSVEVIDLTRATGNHAVTLTSSHITGTENNSITLRYGAGNVMLDTETAGGVGAVAVEGTGLVTLRNVDGQSVSVSDAIAGRIQGSSRADEIQGGARNDTLNGNDGNDSIDGGAGNDAINGGAGDDSITGGTGVNTVTGGTGTDRYVVSAGETLIITDFDLTNTFERIDLSRFAGLRYADLVMADAADGVVISLPGSTTVRVLGASRSAMDATKFFFEGMLPSLAFQLTAGADSFVGGAGDDLFDVVGNIANLNAATDRLQGGAGIDTLRISGADRVLSAQLLNVMQSVEVIDLTRATGNHAVTLTSSHITGTENNSITLRYGAGNVILDTETAGGVRAVVIEGTGQVTLRNVDGQSVSVSDAIAGRIQGSSRADEILGGARSDTLSGNDGDDTITGGGGNDNINGGAGNDRLISSAGDDRLAGGTGNDSYVVLRNAGVTTLTDYQAANLLERIDLTDFTGLARFSDLTLTNVGADVRVTATNLNILIKGVQANALDAGDFLFQGQDPLVFNVTPQTSMAELQHLLNEAPAGAVINLAAGVYSVTETLLISRSDISLVGAGEGQTIFRTDIPDANAGETILVQPRTLFNRLGTITADAVEGTTTVTLQNGHGLAVGDLLYLSQANDAAWLAATGNTDWVDPASLSPDADPELSYLREMHSKIVAINGNTITLAEPLPYTFQAGIAQAAEDLFLSNVHLRNFSIQGSWGVANPFLFEDTKPEWVSVAALEFDGVRDSSIRNITITDPAAHGFKMQRSYEVTGDALTAVGAHNKDGASGYQFYFQESFSNNFTGLVALDGRHAVLFSSFSAEHYNTIEVLRTNRDINFHGSPDSDNTIYIDRMEQNYPAGSLPQWKAVSPGSFPEHPLSTIDANDVTFRYAVTGEDHDTVVAGVNAAYISTNAGRDTLVGGAGDDTLDGGIGTDTMSGGGGRDRFIREYADLSDTILDFQTGASGDIFVIRGTGYGAFSELVLRQVGANAVLDFGIGGTTTFVNTQVSALQAVNFLFQNDTASGRTLTPRADQLFLLGTDKADTFMVTRSHITSPDFLVRAGSGYDKVVINTSSLAGSLASIGSLYRVDAFDVASVTTVDISITNQMAARSDSKKFYLHVGDTGSAVRLALGTLNTGHSIWVDGSREVDLVGSVAQNLRATDRVGVHVTGSAQGDRITGGARNDWLDGAAGADVLSGGGGNDTIYGGQGADTMTGGQGSDVFYVDNAADRVIEETNWTGSDEVIASVNYTLGAGSVEKLTLVGTAISGTGNSGRNLIVGNGQNNTLNGGSGNDTLQGQGGADSFVFNTSLGSTNVDRIVDFSAPDDQIVLAAGIFGLPAGALAAGAFHLGSAAMDGNDRILYDQSTGRLYLDRDGNGSGVAELFAILDNRATISAADFLIS